MVKLKCNAIIKNGIHSYIKEVISVLYNNLIDECHTW